MVEARFLTVKAAGHREVREDGYNYVWLRLALETSG
jgi:hypothetical protein